MQQHLHARDLVLAEEPHCLLRWVALMPTESLRRQQGFRQFIAECRSEISSPIKSNR
ncbi:hypothetical protein RE6C_00661 [Rhodopirellula europaea 6C]|uniref:Uncharacterized protein n=1 Tax=Rhodopirellula europaea 6C TaxID=1263867 RepID=M2B110_9BACT|nr:hypothetical protein RE6C_00661 [Rhodopirellula europaea 6C]